MPDDDAVAPDPLQPKPGVPSAWPTFFGLATPLKPHFLGRTSDGSLRGLLSHADSLGKDHTVVDVNYRGSAGRVAGNAGQLSRGDYLRVLRAAAGNEPPMVSLRRELDRLNQTLTDLGVDTGYEPTRSQVPTRAIAAASHQRALDGAKPAAGPRLT